MPSIRSLINRDNISSKNGMCVGGSRVLGHLHPRLLCCRSSDCEQKVRKPLGLIGGAASSELAIMIVIMSVGHISGAHLNPAVTIAFAGLRHLPFLHVPAYIFAQVMASIGASFILKAVFHPFHSGGITTPATGDGQAFVCQSSFLPFASCLSSFLWQLIREL